MLTSMLYPASPVTFNSLDTAMLSAVSSLKVINRNLVKTQAATAADPAVKRETENFKANIAKVKTSKEFVNNYRLFSYAMRAHGLSEMTYAKAYMQKILDGGVNDTKSMANKMSDPRFKAFAAAFDFGDKGAAATTDSTLGITTAEKFIVQTMEDKASEQNPGVKLALYFQRIAPKITSPLTILADKALYQFVQTAFNLPPRPASSTIAQDAAAITKRLNISVLHDPVKLQKLVSRFAVMYDLQNPTSTNSTSSLAMALSSSSSGATVSQSLLQSIQQRYSRY
jgi:hypothetical protein